MDVRDCITQLPPGICQIIGTYLDWGILYLAQANNVFISRALSHTIQQNNASSDFCRLSSCFWNLVYVDEVNLVVYCIDHGADQEKYINYANLFCINGDCMRSHCSLHIFRIIFNYANPYYFNYYKYHSIQYGNNMAYKHIIAMTILRNIPCDFASDFRDAHTYKNVAVAQYCIAMCPYMRDVWMEQLLRRVDLHIDFAIALRGHSYADNTFYNIFIQYISNNDPRLMNIRLVFAKECTEKWFISAALHLAIRGDIDALNILLTLSAANDPRVKQLYTTQIQHKRKIIDACSPIIIQWFATL